MLTVKRLAVTSSAFTVMVGLIVGLMLGAPQGVLASDSHQPDERRDAASLAVRDALICIDHLGHPTGGWITGFRANIKVPGAANEMVEVRLLAPAWGVDQVRQYYVDRDGLVVVGSNNTVSRETLAEAKADAQAGVGAVTVEVRPVSGGAPLTVEVTSWRVSEPAKLVSVKVRRVGQKVTYSGRLVTESGKPVSTGAVGIYTITGTSTNETGTSAFTNSRGAFTVTATIPKRKGTGTAISARAYGKWCSTVWSTVRST